MLAKWIEVRIDFGVIDKTCAHLFESRAEHLQGRLRVLQVISKGTYEIVTHRQVFGIDQQRATHPFFCPLALTQHRQGVTAVAHGRAVVRIVRQNLFCTGQRNFGRPSSRLTIPERSIASNQHAGRSEVPFLQRHRLFKVANGLFESLLSKSQNSSTFVDLLRFRIEPKSDLDFARRFVVAFFFRQYPGFDCVGFGQIRV